MSGDIKEATSPETALVLAIRDGDDQAFKALYFQYADPLFRFLYRKTNQREIAEELVQELFVKVWRNRNNLDPHQSIKAYLYQAANHVAIDHLRKKVITPTGGEVRPEHRTSEIDEEAFERKARIQDAIRQLSETQRNVFCASRFDGLTYKEIAETEGISVKTVEVHMGRALKKLRESLKDLVFLFLFFFLFIR